MFTQYYADLADKFIILCCSTIYYFCQKDMEISVVPLLIAVIISGFLSYFENYRLKAALIILYTALSCVIPQLAVFLPLMAYDALFGIYSWLWVFLVLPIVVLARNAPIESVFLMIVMLALSIMVKYHVEQKNKLQAEYNSFTDEAREMSMRLERQNRELLENQDNELALAALNERTRIAREIHDNVGHLLSSAILQAGALLMINRDETLKKHLADLKDTLSQAMDNIRTSVHELYNESIDLDAVLKSIVKQFTFCDVNYEYHVYSNPDRKVKYAFISIIKEALSNVMKHSNASLVTILLREHPAFYQLVIRDNGTVERSRTVDGMGLINMADRVNALSGNINITTDIGFQIFITVPKEG